MYSLFQSKPPRRIGLVSTLALLNSGIMTIMGWAFMCIGLVFFWVFFMNSEILNLFDPPNWERTEGEVVYITETSASENESTIYRITFNYRVAGQEYHGTAYGLSSLPSEGEIVTVFFDPDDPELCRIQGYRRNMFGVFVGFVVIFPLLGLIFILVGYWHNAKTLLLLRNGYFAMGKLVDTKSTMTSVNHHPVYAMVFEFTDQRGQVHYLRGRSHQPHKLTDEEEEPLLYLPHNPSKGVMFDGLPYEPTLKGDNRLAFPAAMLLTLIAPLFTLLSHGFYVLIAYGNLEMFK